jgi:hypothetical protein
MPKILVQVDTEIDTEVDVTDYLYECDEDEIQEAIQWLKDKEYIKDSAMTTQVSVAESEFIEALDKIYNKWNVLSKEETDFIINISKRF